MKKRSIIVFGIMAALFFAAGCTRLSAGNKDIDSTEEEDQSESADLGEILFPDEDLPSVEQQYAETEEYPKLAEFLTDYYQIPEDEQEETRYYYNYVDLNEDGRQEIFAIIIREDALGDDGGPALILAAEEGGTFAVLEDFMEVITPIMISEHTTNGWHDVIYSANDMLERGFLVCRYDLQAGYHSEENEFLPEMPQVSGVEILSNNLIDDMDQGNYMTLKN